MIPIINGKSLLDCSAQDLQVLINNTDYRENEYLDFKLNLSYLEMPRGQERNKGKIEFRNDVCSFANADDGCIVLGISDINGCASTIEGVEIANDNTDKYELDRRNDLNGIQPKIPHIQFSFIKLESCRYVVVLYIKHDNFSPYIYLEDEKNYKIYKRCGNGKRPMQYAEIRQMFIQSLSLENEILKYRKERIQYYLDNAEHYGNRFLHLCIIPDVFIDKAYHQKMYILEQSRRLPFSSFFVSFGCGTESIPCVDGLRFMPYDTSLDNAECYVRNNGIIEATLFLDKIIKYKTDSDSNGFLPWGVLWQKIEGICRNYFVQFSAIRNWDRAFICLSLVGCKDVLTTLPDFLNDYNGIIDRNIVICDPIEIIEFNDDISINKTLMYLHLTFLLSIGIKHDKSVRKLVKELYNI